MFEVYPVDDGFRWQMVSVSGLPLYYGDDTVYDTDVAAATAASDWRANFWAITQCIERFPGSF